MTQKAPIRPVGYRVLIKLEKVENTSKGGIITMTQAEEERQQSGHYAGKVVAIGSTAYAGDDARFADGPWCKVGDVVAFPRYAGFKITKEEGGQKETWHMINDEDVVGVFNDE